MKLLSKTLLLLFATLSLIIFFSLNNINAQNNEEKINQLTDEISALRKDFSAFAEEHRRLQEEEHSRLEQGQASITHTHEVIEEKQSEAERLNIIYAKTVKTAKIYAIGASLGALFLLFLIFYTWRSVANVNRNTIEVIFAFEEIRNRLSEISDGKKVLHEMKSEPKTKNRVLNEQEKMEASESIEKKLSSNHKPEEKEKEEGK